MPEQTKEIQKEVAKEPSKKEEPKQMEKRDLLGTLKKRYQSEIKKATTEEKHELLKMSEISLWLDTYDDIFSDFDPRPYSQRALSEDFLNETKRASCEKTSGQIELKFLVPSGIRNLERESMIKKRLREHFKKHYNILHLENVNIKRTGAICTAIGFLMMIVFVFISNFGINEQILNILRVFLEPGGWFMMWFGLDQIFYTAKAHLPDTLFYEKMSKCEINFMKY
jgi:hypothetical protein